jgi:ABC-type transport system involved in multi-copper enzyme maturation permease subunit
MEFDLTQLKPFWEWFPWAAANFVIVVVVLTIAVLVLGTLFSIIRHGPVKGFPWFIRLCSEGFKDLVFISPRRVAALTWLAVKESIRRRVVLAVIGVFFLTLFFAGWFMDADSSNPTQLFISFALGWPWFLVLLFSWFLCTLSIPTDLKNKTLHTIVTKPVRSSEIILGRILGFVAIGTVLLALMGTVCFFFVVRGLSHAHTLDVEKLHAAEGSDQANPALTAKTSSAQGHVHAVRIEPDGTAIIEPSHSHTHSIEVVKEGDKIVQCEIGQPEDELIARVPRFGELSFIDRNGQKAARGISVGKEWNYRSYIEGGTDAAAIWKFTGVTESQFPDGMPIGMRISVYRSWKGHIEKGIIGSLKLYDYKQKRWVEAKIFTAKHDVIDLQNIDRQWQDRDGKTVDIFEDMVQDGELQVMLRCDDPTQYYGVAQADLFLSTPNAPFFLNYIKGYLGIWLQMVLLISMGVFFSTFLSGPVALLSTAGMMIGGMCHSFIFQLATGYAPNGDPLYGGGPFESVVRMLTQDNIISEMEPGLRTTVVQSLDKVFQPVLYTVSSILPDFRMFDFSNYIAGGFNVPGEMLIKFFFRAAAFAIPAFIAAYLCLKTREVAK